MGKIKHVRSGGGNLPLLLIPLAAGGGSWLAAFLVLGKMVEAQGLSMQASILPATLAAALGAGVGGFALARCHGGQGLLCGAVSSGVVCVVFIGGILLQGMPDLTLYTPLKLFAFTAAGRFGGYLGGLRPRTLKHRRLGA